MEKMEGIKMKNKKVNDIFYCLASFFYILWFIIFCIKGDIKSGVYSIIFLILSIEHRRLSDEKR